MRKNVFITGVLSNHGVALAKAFKEAGYYVYGVDAREDFEGIGDRVFRFELDKFVEEAEYRIRFTNIFNEVIPRLDVLINNASVQILGSLNEIKLDDWHKTINSNLTGPMLLSKLFLERLSLSTGAIINVGSIHHQMTLPGHVSFATTMSGLIGLTKSMAVDLEGKVRVNSISCLPQANFSPEVARLAVYLASEETNRIQGANFQVDGGTSSVFNG